MPDGLPICPRCGLPVTSSRRHEERLADDTVRVWHQGCWWSHRWEGGHYDRRQRDRRKPDEDRRTGLDRRDE